MNLDPAKLLVILVIALIVLGPERLPRVARQLGALWREITVTRDRLVNEIKEQVPDIPDPRDLRSRFFDPAKSAGGLWNIPTGRDAKDAPGSGEPPSDQWQSQLERKVRDDELRPSGFSDPSMN